MIGLWKMEAWIGRRQRRIEKNGRGFVLRQDGLKGHKEKKCYYIILLETISSKILMSCYPFKYYNNIIILLILRLDNE